MDTPSHVNPQSNITDNGTTVQGPEHRTTSIGSMQGELLSCILGLMRPMIAEHLLISDEHIETYFINVAAGDEGKKLISALNDFMRAGVLAAIQQADGASRTLATEDKTDKNIPSSKCTESVEQVPDKESKKSVTAIEPRIPPKVQPTELESMIQQQTRAYVFNHMPIRMLEFDSNGSNIKLIGRDDIFRILILRIQAKVNSPEFQKDWNGALGLRDLDSTWYMHRSNKMNEVIAKAVSGIASYAILSHTWIRESPGDVVFNTWNSRSLNHRGWTKIKKFCRVAAHDHEMTLGWVDSVCVNKDSSSELDESIRSMYKWYRGSHICVTYLSNTGTLGDGTRDSWFTRGWTLQELLAPKHTAFYNQHWEALGTDKDHAIESLVAAETTIISNEMELFRSGRVKDIPISRILQLASQRQVTREEDSAYSLFGLLDVNMSVAYGEGVNSASRRLFQELLSTRKHVLDLFNRQYHKDDSLIPVSLKRYSYRSLGFDGDSGSMLDSYEPPEPIILTHRGIRCQWLLVPALVLEKDTADAKYTPKGHYSCQQLYSLMLPSGGSVKCVCNMLDDRLYGDNNKFMHPLRDIIPLQSLQPTIVVPTLTLKGDLLLLPDKLMGITVYTPDKPGTIHTGSAIRILPLTGPTIFTLINTTGGKAREIPIQDLERHGMQLVTLYL